MQNLVNLYNQALSSVGSSPTITNPLGGDKAKLNILNLWFPVARQAVFTAFHWPSLRKSSRLALQVSRTEGSEWTNASPAPDYLYGYAYPSDMLHPQYMEDFSPFELGTVGNSRLIFSNQQAPILRYTFDREDPQFWEAPLYRCVIWALAACINMANNGKMNVTQKLEQQVQGMLEAESANLANTDDQYFDSPPSYYAGTGFSYPSVTPRFYFPTSSYRVSPVV